jgi:O-antigen ligase
MSGPLLRLPFPNLPKDASSLWSAAVALGVLLGLSGFFIGRAVFTIAYLYLGLISCLALAKGAPLRAQLKKPPFQSLVQLWAVFALLSPTLWSGKTVFFSANLLAFPLLLLAFLLATLPPVSRSHLHKVMLALGIVAGISLLWVLSDNFLFSENTLLSLSQGQAPKTPVHHIRYSFAICLASWSILYLSTQTHHSKHKNLLWILGFSLALGLHFLSVKSGLLAWYAIALGTLLKNIHHQGWKRYHTMLLALTVLLPIAAYGLLPSFATKMDYFLYDLKKIGTSEAGSYSDAKRWEAAKIGMALFFEKPFSGHGQKAFQERHTAAMLEKFPQAQPILPHSDWITLLGYGGLITLGLFAYSLWQLFLFWEFPKSYPAWALGLLWLTSMGVDNHFATSTGMALFVFPAMLLHFLKASKNGATNPLSSAG